MSAFCQTVCIYRRVFSGVSLHSQWVVRSLLPTRLVHKVWLISISICLSIRVHCSCFAGAGFCLNTKSKSNTSQWNLKGDATSRRRAGCNIVANWLLWLNRELWSFTDMYLYIYQYITLCTHEHRKWISSATLLQRCFSTSLLSSRAPQRDLI